MSGPVFNTTELTRRHYVLSGGLALAVAACMWVAQSDAVTDIAQPSKGTTRPLAPPITGAVRTTTGNSEFSTAASSMVVDWAPVPRQTWANAPSLLAWGPPPAPPAPPPAPPPPPPPAAPVAPQFPYQLIGMLEDGGSQALLSGPDRTLSVKVGDSIDAQWSVEKITANSITLKWLPANLTQTIAFRPTI